MPDSPDLSAFIASRICHDLISPIGAIGNGIDLLGMDARQPSPELQLLSDSVTQANARIRFFRIGFGAATQDQRIARGEVTSILGDLSRDLRVSYSWTSTGDLSRREVRLVFLLLLCVESALAYGGRVAVVQEGSGWTIRAEGARLKLVLPLWDGLSGGALPDSLTAAEVQFALVPQALAALGRRLVVDLSPTAIRISF